MRTERDSGMAKCTLKVQKNGNFVTPFLTFVLFIVSYEYILLFCTKIFDWAIIGGDAIFPLSLRQSGIEFSLV
jgi:hypothetical protein